MPTRRSRKDDSRIDKAIDHFAAIGYAARDIRAIVGGLVNVYGGPSRDVWSLLEEGFYEVVQNRLFEIEEDEKQKQDALLLLLDYHHQHDGQQVEDEPPLVG